MKIWTYSELQSKVERDLSTEDETFVQTTELLGYFNEGLDQAEQEVITLYEDYFLSKTTLTLVSGQEEYTLPTDIYAQKIRRVIYNNGSEFYPIARIRDWKKFETYSDTKMYGTSDSYRYFLYNPSPVQSKMILVPQSRENGAFVTIWFIRSATHFTGASTDTLDMPEAANFILQFVKNKVIAKEIYPNPLPQERVNELDQERELLKSTLANMVPDADNEIEADLTYYEEMN